MSQLTEHVEQSNLAVTEASKKAYHAPHLLDYGHVRDVTQSNPNGPNNDQGGNYPNVYTS